MRCCTDAGEGEWDMWLRRVTEIVFAALIIGFIIFLLVAPSPDSAVFECSFYDPFDAC